jgi:TRAP-type C4-dicarboxylate transport system permease small subunit
MAAMGTKIFRKADDIICRIASAGTYIGGFLLFLMMLLISADAIGRYIFFDSIKGSLDIIEIMLVFVVFFSVGQVAVLKSHVSVALIFSRFPMRLQVVLNIITALLCFGISFLMVRQLFLRGLAQISYTVSYSPSLQIPLWPIYLVASPGLLLLSVVFLMDFIRCLTNVES